MAARDKAEQAPREEAPPMPPQAPQWKDPVFRAALWFGGGLVLTGVACVTALPIVQTVSVLILCSGLGILFGAFGATAVIRYKGIVIAGVASIAIALVGLVNYLTRDNIVRVRIAGDVKGSALDLYGDEAYPGADRSHFHEFVVIGRELRIAHLSLVVTVPVSSDLHARPDEHREIIFDCIPVAAISPFLGSGRTLQWRLDVTKEKLSGVAGKEVSSGPCEGGESPRKAAAPEFANALVSLMPAAHAQVPGKSAASPAPYIRDLYSDSATVRREARQSLSRVGINAIPELMAEWERNPTHYRVRLGASVALAEFLRANKSQRAAVSARLTVKHLELLTLAAGDPDRTTRIYASEFLYDLGDKRVLPIVQRVFPQVTEDGKFNLILVLKGLSPVLSESEKRSRNGSLNQWRAAAGPKTRAQIDALMASG